MSHSRLAIREWPRRGERRGTVKDERHVSTRRAGATGLNAWGARTTRPSARERPCWRARLCVSAGQLALARGSDEIQLPRADPIRELWLVTFSLGRERASIAKTCLMCYIISCILSQSWVVAQPGDVAVVKLGEFLLGHRTRQHSLLFHRRRRSFRGVVFPLLQRVHHVVPRHIE